MIPAPFDYVRAGSAEEAVALLVEHGDEAKLLAGGHSLLPLMKLRLAIPSVLIDVGRVHELSFIEEQGDEVAIGALTRHHDLETSSLLKEQVPMLPYIAHQVGDPQVRHRGTLGGSLAHGDPASDLPAAILALGGTLVAQGPGGRREIAAVDFFKGFLETALAPDEMLVEIRVPKAPGAGWSFQKFNRRAQDWAIGCAAGHLAHLCFHQVLARALGHGDDGVATAVEAAVGGGASVGDAALLAAEGADPPSDINASSEYRRHLATVLVRRALEEATS